MSQIINSTKIVEELNKPFRERKVSVEGILLNVREEGEGTHNILCLPGLAGTIETHFGKIFATFDRTRFRLISWDPPGYGKSRPPSKDHSGDFWRRDALLIAKLMDQLGYEKYSILGWSNGGQTAYHLAIEFPEKVNKLVVWGSHGFYNEEFIPRSYALTNLKNWTRELEAYEEDYLNELLANWFNNVKNWILSGEAAVLKTYFPRIQCPTLALHGSKDFLVKREQADYIFSNVKNCKLYVVEGAKHDPHLTHTTEFLSVVQSFFLGEEDGNKL